MICTNKYEFKVISLSKNFFYWKGCDLMSENTNTLFWIITGAVIVVAIFGLLQNNITDSISGIFDHFNGLFN